MKLLHILAMAGLTVRSKKVKNAIVCPFDVVGEGGNRGDIWRRVDIWRNRCDQCLCKILVSRVNFQKTSQTAEQST